MKKRQKIAVDIDDVLADSTDALRILVNESTSVQLEQHHYRVPGEYWSYYDRIWAEHGIADEVELSELERGMVEDQSHIRPIYGAQEAIKSLSMDYDIAFLSSRSDELEVATIAWLMDHFEFGVSHEELYLIGNHKTTANPVSKGEKCREIGARWLIDDNPQHCLSAIEHGTDAILFGSYGWHIEVPDHLVKLTSWSGITEFLHAKA